MTHVKVRKKLIEVALPLPEINDASSYDKMPGIGPHPKGIHHWWARLPLPSARAVLFASVVTDPQDDPRWRDKSEAEQDAERERLFDIVRRMMAKKLHEHPEVYEEAQKEMLRYCHQKLPTLLDPFAGGGSIPLEAARLGFEVCAADLNPVAVLLNKCNLELASSWVNRPPINPENRLRIGGEQAWRGTHGLAADVRYYGRLVRRTVEKKLGYLYPNVRLPKDHGGGDGKIVAWLWARTVSSQDPAARGALVPLLSTYWLSTVPHKLVWLSPVVNRAASTYHFDIKTGTPTDKVTIRAGTKIGRGGKFKCVLSNQPIDIEHLRREAQALRTGYRLTAIVVETPSGRTYLPADEDQEKLAASVEKPEELNLPLVESARHLTPTSYGMLAHRDLYTARQLSTLLAISDAVREIGLVVSSDAIGARMSTADAGEYSVAVTTFLALALGRSADFNNSLTGWSASNQKVMHLFGRAAIPMIWDFAEANTLGDSVGSWSTCCDYVADCIEVLTNGKASCGEAAQVDAANGTTADESLFISTDPPYYDNVPYADLSDFFYVWLRRTIGNLHPPLFDTVLVPKCMN